MAIIPFDVGEQMNRDREIWGKRIRCIPARQLAEEYGLPLTEVHASIARMSAGISPAMRNEMRVLELDRCDDLESYWYERAKTEYEAFMVVAKIMDVRSRLTGLLQSPSTDTNFEERIRNREKSTVAYERQLALLVGKPVGTVIDGDATVVDNVEPCEA